MKKNKRVALLDKKEQLIKRITPILEKFTDSTGLIVKSIICDEPDTYVITNKAEQEIGVGTKYNLNVEIEL